MFKVPFTLQSDEPLSPHLIAVDTEYHTTNGVIDKVFCAVFTVKYSDQPLKIWTGNETSHPSILSDAASHFGIENPIFVCHAFEKAEFQAFRFLDAEPEAFRWFDTQLAYRLNAKEFGEKDDNGSDASLSETYAMLCKHLLNVEIDCERKEAMRKLCIDDQTQGHEDEIMDYCYDDTRYLIPCVQKLYEEYRLILDDALLIRTRTRFESQPPRRELWMRLQDAQRAFACIATRGLPVNVERCDAVKAGAKVMFDKRTREFLAKYPGSYELVVLDSLRKKASDAELLALHDMPTLDEAIKAFQGYISDVSDKQRDILNRRLEQFYTSDGKLWKKNVTACQKYLADYLRKVDLLDEWPKTSTGVLSMKAEDLKRFKMSDSSYLDDCFPADYLRLSEVLTALNGVQKDWMNNLDRDAAIMRYQSMRSFRSITGRAQPSPSQGFVPLWSHSLYGVLEPPEGQWLVELDFSSEETFIQACVFNDPAYREAYHSKHDIYLYIGLQLGLIPREDYDTMTTEDLKHKYKQVRKRLKTFTLAQSYGSGVKTLAIKAGLTPDQVEPLKNAIDNKVFKVATAFKKELRYLIQYGFDYTKTKMYSALLLESGYFAKLGDKGKILSQLNFPIQGLGGAILQKLVCELELLGIETVCTIHDAVMFLADEGDYDTINLVRKTMKDVADYVLGVKDQTQGMKVGEPIILKHGEIWHEDDEDYKASLEVLRAGGYAC